MSRGVSKLTINISVKKTAQGLMSLQTCRYKQHRPVIVAVQSLITELDNKKEHWGDFSKEEASWELLDSSQNVSSVQTQRF